MAKLAANQYVFEKDISYVLETAIHAFKQTIRKIKKATVKNPIAYFYTVSNNKFAQQFYEPEEAHQTMKSVASTHETKAFLKKVSS